VIELDYGRLGQLLALAARIGVAELPDVLRRNGQRIGPEVLALAALCAPSGQDGPTVPDPSHGGQGARVLAYRYVDAARMLDVSERTIKRMVASGDLRAISIAGARRVPHDELVDFVNRKLGEAA